MAAPPEEVAPRRRRSWPRRLLIVANITVAVCVVAAASSYGYVLWRFGQIDKQDLCHVLRGCSEDMSGEPLNVLVVGSDTRATIDPGEQSKFGSTKDAAGQRSDSIIVLRVDPEREQAAMLSIPRDLFVPIAGTEGSDRINTAFEAGPDRLIATIQDALGVPIHHYVQIDFNGFRGIVDAVGGVPVYSPARARDKKSGLNIPNPGCVTLDGEQALAYVRSRDYEYFENGRWRRDPTADLGRIDRQQDFVRRLLQKANAKARGLNLLAINRMVGTGIKNVEIDERFDTGKISRLALRFKSLEPDAVQMLIVPTVPAKVGGASVLRLKQPDAQQVLDTFLAKDPPPEAGATGAGAAVPGIPPARIRVRVLNGSGAEGQAREVGQALQGLGFNVAGLGQADSFRYQDSAISYGRGQRDKALVVQSKILGGSVLKEDESLQAVDVVLVTGGRFGGVEGAPAPAATGAAAAPGSGTAPATTEDPPAPGRQC